MTDRPTYIIEVCPMPDQPLGVENLKMLLKGLLNRRRAGGYRVVDVREGEGIVREFDDPRGNPITTMPMRRCD